MLSTEPAQQQALGPVNARQHDAHQGLLVLPCIPKDEAGRLDSVGKEPETGFHSKHRGGVGVIMRLYFCVYLRFTVVFPCMAD